MAKEIERKYLVTDTGYRTMASRVISISQGYLARGAATVRVRLADDKAFLTIKGRNRGMVRDEWEYAIPADDGRQMLERCATGRVISKKRYIVDYQGYRWEIDEFEGSLAPLVVAEIELPDPEAAFALPPFIGREVTDDPRYYNSNLANCEELPS